MDRLEITELQRSRFPGVTKKCRGAYYNIFGGSVVLIWQQRFYQVIPGNDQNTSPTNQRTIGSKLQRTS